MEIKLAESAEIFSGNQQTKTKGCTPTQPTIQGQHIVVLDRGFVYVGDAIIEGDFLYLSNAKNIRYWGTKNGLGELRNGPLKETKLDDIGDVIAPIRALIHLVPVKGF